MNPRNYDRPAVEAAAAEWIARRDAGMTSAEQAEFEHWQSADPRHARALARHDQAWSLLDRPQQSHQVERVMLELRHRARRRSRRRVLATVTCVATLAGAAFLWETRDVTGGDVRVAANATAVVIQPERRTLSEGSVVELKRGAEIDVRFNAAYRRVVLKQGEAHFQVETDEKRPFIVTARGVDFRAVGTAFSVQLGSARVEVLVTEGRVSVQQTAERPAVAADTAERQLGTIAAGNRLIVDLAAKLSGAPPTPERLSPEEVATQLAWRATRLEFTGTPLGEAIALMNRHNRVQFVIDDPALVGIEVSGFFRADNTEAFALLLEGSFGVNVQRSGETVVLRRAVIRE